MPLPRISEKARAATNVALRYASMLRPEYRAAKTGRAPEGTPAERQLAAAMSWLCRAQDATPDGGVSRGFALLHKPYFGGRGWQPSYPETTGYIIPTFYDYAQRSGDSSFTERAARMAAWESECQLPNGAVQGGVIGQARSPAVFNTGQVIFGWLRAHRETGEASFLDSAVRAGGFLVGRMARDGGWYAELSDYAGDGRMRYYAYNVRCAWALAELGKATSNRSFVEAAARAGTFARERQLENGWLPSNCLFDPERPLLHTIAYSARGLIETGAALDMPELIEGGRQIADGVLSSQRDDGYLASRFDRAWRSTEDYSCLTGVAQIALCWGRLFQIGDGAHYRMALARASSYLRGHQVFAPANPSLHGGIPGSSPLYGRYGAYELLNWAAKFFADMLMLEATLAPPGSVEA